MLLLAVIALLVTGCEKQTKYKVLTFFFTGVPPIDGVKESDSGKKEAAKKKKSRRRIPQIFIHGPKASGECFYCHDTASTQSFRQTKQGGVPRLGQIKPGRLVAPLKELCVQCHISKSPELQYISNLWVHGPIAEGFCTSCHDYHQTKFEYMLLRESSIDLCTQCHAGGFIVETEAHTGGEECISCHNPHLGANRLLLRKDFDEVF